MNKFPPRPVLDEETIRRALKDETFTKDLKRWAPETELNEVREPIAEILSMEPHLDGYELARSLEKEYWWDGLTLKDVKVLDDVVNRLHTWLRKEELCWARENNIQPQYAPGTELVEGVIEGVCEYSAAKYKVRAWNETRPGHFLLIKFEDAKLKNEN